MRDGRAKPSSAALLPRFGMVHPFRRACNTDQQAVPGAVLFRPCKAVVCWHVPNYTEEM